jgi:hypothetical protein
MSMLSMADARLAREQLERRPRRTQRSQDEERASLTPSTGPHERAPGTDIRDSDSGFQGYASQLVRYFPTEIVAAYLFFVTQLSSIDTASCHADFASRWRALVGFAIAAPILQILIYKARSRASGQRSGVPWFECVIGLVAFVAWASALPGTPFADSCGWKPGYGAFAAGVVAVLIPLVAQATGHALAADPD